jgi:hypothetical protein
MDVKRIIAMINADKISQNEFKTLSSNGARHIIRRFIPDEDTTEKLVEVVEPETITGFQLRDIMTSNHTFDSIKATIEQMVKEFNEGSTNNVMSMHLLPKSIEVEKKETEYEKKQRIGLPRYSIENLMKECDVHI